MSARSDTPTDDRGLDRRRFLKILGVTGGGAAALTGCSSDKVEKLIPYLVPPENQIPGIATWYASTCRECPAGCGLHVRVREGRAVKVEGNPEHPVNQGRLCARGQATLQGLYNPDRVRQPMRRGPDGRFVALSWDEAMALVTEALARTSGDQIRFVTGHETGSFGRLVDEWLAAQRAPGRITFEAFGFEALRTANELVFGIAAVPRYDFSAVECVLSFGVDFLETWRSPVEQTRGFTEGHAYRNGHMGWYVHVEPRMSLTAMSADEWIAPVPGSEALVALAIARVIVREGLASPPPDLYRMQPVLAAFEPEAMAGRTGVSAETIERLAREFASQPSLALAGGMGAQHGQAHWTAVAVSVLNYVAGNVGRSLQFQRADTLTPSNYEQITRLVRTMRNGGVGVALFHGANPAYATPRALGFADAMEQVGFKVSFSRFLDETASSCDLVLPDHDPLEQWSDSEPQLGLFALQQPVMQPVFETRQTGDVLLTLAREVGGALGARFSTSNFKEYLQASWRTIQQRAGDRRDFDAYWAEALQRGGVWMEAETRPVRLRPSVERVREVEAWVPESGLTLLAYPSPALYDGRGANRPWLQELPDPVTKVTWSSCVEIHPETAAEYGIAEGDVVEITSPHGSIEVPAYLYPGLRRDVIAVAMGQGHRAFGRYAEGRGANVLDLLSPDATSFRAVEAYASVTIRPTGAHERLAKTEGTPRQLGRGIAQAVSLEAAAHGGEHGAHAHAAPVPEHIEEVLDEWQEAQYEEYRRGNYEGDLPRWGLAIDLSRCTGCSACVTACHAENNIPHVGADLVRRGREMSWLRIERYYEGGEHGEPFEARVVPVMCQQCANAPCEPVCPVFAAFHTPDGLNGQVYNRCVGTRYCSNNCPYKVRYFNWFDFQQEGDPFFAYPDPLHWLLNPDVTVRSKGVMEKCTFCVQRIRERQNQAALADRELSDGEVETACEQTCPADAIVFGDMNDPNSRVSQIARDSRGYQVLGDLNTRPAVTYLQKVRNVAEE